MEEASWRRNHGGGTMEEASSWRLTGGTWEASGRHLGAIWEHLGGIWEAFGRHLGGIWEVWAPKASPRWSERAGTQKSVTPLS